MFNDDEEGADDILFALKLDKENFSVKKIRDLPKFSSCRCNIYATDPNIFIVMHFSMKQNTLVVADDITLYCYCVQDFLNSEEEEVSVQNLKTVKYDCDLKIIAIIDDGFDGTSIVFETL